LRNARRPDADPAGRSSCRSRIRIGPASDFFLVIVSGPKARTVPVSVRVISQPLQQLTCRPSSSVTVTAIRGAHSRVYQYQLEEER
jgi:hypothetical protein